MRIRLRSLLVPAVVALVLPVTASEAVVVASVERGIVRGDLGPAAAPELVLRRVADTLDVEPADFAFRLTRESLVGIHHRGVQLVDGVPVDGTRAAVHVVNGRVVKAEAVATDATGGATPVPLAREAAEAHALAAMGVHEPVALHSERLLVPTDGVLVDTWRVTLLAPAVAATVDVSATDGRVLAIGDDRRFEDATATLFDPNPIATSGHLDMAQDVDVAGVDVDFTTDERVAEELVDLPVLDFDAARAAAGNLVGPWVDVLGAGPFVPVDGRFDVIKTDPRFEGLMGYHHIDAIQRYFQDELGLEGINQESQTFIALPVMGFDNSFYMSGVDLILVGAGGVDDGEDAEVIIHELGHAIQDDQVPGWGRSFEGGAMGEGFGDFLAAAYYATFDDTVRSQDTCLMEWDATSYAAGPQTCLRRTDTEKTYADLDNSVHSSGEIWSKYLWNVRARLGETEGERSYHVLRLLLTAQFMMSTDADFREAIADLQVVAASEGIAPDAETGQEWVQILREEAIAMGMPL